MGVQCILIPRNSHFIWNGKQTEEREVQCLGLYHWAVTVTTSVCECEQGKQLQHSVWHTILAYPPFFPISHLFLPYLEVWTAFGAVQVFLQGPAVTAAEVFSVHCFTHSFPALTHPYRPQDIPVKLPILKLCAALLSALATQNDIPSTICLFSWNNLICNSQRIFPALHIALSVPIRLFIFRKFLN